MITLVSPNHAQLAAYAAALQTGWSPNNTRDVCAEQLAEIAADPDLFLRTLRGEVGGTIKLGDGREVERLPGVVFWIWDGEFCGAINLRYAPGTVSLPPHVLGHAGYAIIPSKRRRGYATAALRQLLPIARQHGLPRMLVTCDADNTISRRVIERCGGVDAHSTDPERLYYWIDLLGDAAMPPLPDIIEDGIAAWSGIVPPNDPARRMAADMATTIAAFEALRGTLRFEDEPSSFEAALQATKEA